MKTTNNNFNTEEIIKRFKETDRFYVKIIPNLREDRKAQIKNKTLICSSCIENSRILRVKNARTEARSGGEVAVLQVSPLHDCAKEVIVYEDEIKVVSGDRKRKDWTSCWR